MKTKSFPTFQFIEFLVLVLLIYSCQSEPIPYTAEQLSKVQSFANPKFIPYSSEILYINDESGNLELWKLLESGEKEKITGLNQRINNIQVSRNGKFAVFAADSGGNERFDLFRYDIVSSQIEKITRTSNISETGARISPDGTKIALEADPQIPFRPQICILDLKTNKMTQVTKGEIPVSGPIWSNDGKMLAAVISGDGQIGKLLLIHLASQKIDTINPLSKNNIIIPLEFSRDNSSLLCTSKNDDGFNQLTLIDLKTYDIKLIGPKKWDIIDAKWGNKSDIYFVQLISGRTGIYYLNNLETKAVELMPPNGLIFHMDINQDATNLIFTKQDGCHPNELFYFDLKKNTLRQLTHSLPLGINSERLSQAEHFMVKSFDSTVIEGFYFEPKNISNKPFPAIIQVHGGPSGLNVDNFDAMTQTLSQAGFLILKINYRGSYGYGKAFEDLNNKDWGGGDRKDLRAVTEYFIKQGLIDRNRIGITGGSYGGYMTLIAMTKDPDFYGAGAEAYGMPDLAYDYNLCKDRYGLWYETEMGNPTKDSSLFADRSPINFLDKLRAPLIIFQGANDSNVPKKESDLVFSALTKYGNEPEYIVYQDEGHGFTKRANINDWIQKTAEFFQKKLKVNDF